MKTRIAGVLAATVAVVALVSSGTGAAEARTVSGFGQWYCTGYQDGVVVTAFPFVPSAPVGREVMVTLSNGNTGDVLVQREARVNPAHTVQVDYRPLDGAADRYRVEVRTFGGRLLQRNSTRLGCAVQLP